jgi:hypothetical protein
MDEVDIESIIREREERMREAEEYYKKQKDKAFFLITNMTNILILY